MIHQLKWLKALCGIIACFFCVSCEDEMQDVIPSVPYFNFTINLESPLFTPLKETHHAVYVQHDGYYPPGSSSGHGLFVFRYLEGFTAFDATCPATLACMNNPEHTLTYDGAPKTTVTCGKCGAQYDLIYGGPVKGGKYKLKQYYAARISTISVNIASRKP